MNRYFIVYYFGTYTKTQAQVRGNIVIIAKNKSFFNRKQTVKLIDPNNNLTDVVITGFNEISEQDHLDYINK